MTTPCAAGAAQGGEEISAMHAARAAMAFKRGQRRSHLQGRLTPQPPSNAAYAALSHIAVSNALLINGMFMPKLAFAALFAAGLTGLFATLGATSVARSQDARS